MHSIYFTCFWQRSSWQIVACHIRSFPVLFQVLSIPIQHRNRLLFRGPLYDWNKFVKFCEEWISLYFFRQFLLFLRLVISRQTSDQYVNPGSLGIWVQVGLAETKNIAFWSTINQWQIIDVMLPQSSSGKHLMQVKHRKEMPPQKHTNNISKYQNWFFDKQKRNKTTWTCTAQEMWAISSPPLHWCLHSQNFDIIYKAGDTSTKRMKYMAQNHSFILLWSHCKPQPASLVKTPTMN